MVHEYRINVCVFVRKGRLNILAISEEAYIHAYVENELVWRI